MIPLNEENKEDVSDFIHQELMKANKKCNGCGIICFEDEYICPECKGYSFFSYTKHLDNYCRKEGDEKEILELDLI